MLTRHFRAGLQSLPPFGLGIRRPAIVSFVVKKKLNTKEHEGSTKGHKEILLRKLLANGDGAVQLVHGLQDLQFHVVIDFFLFEEVVDGSV